jgi:hypothetical protein
MSSGLSGWITRGAILIGIVPIAGLVTGELVALLFLIPTIALLFAAAALRSRGM